MSDGIVRGDVPGAAWPPVHSSQTAPLAALIARLERTQWLGAEAIAAGQRAQLAAQARHFQAQSPWFATRLAAAGLAPDDLARPGALQQLPLIERREAQAEFAARPAVPADVPLAKVNTSGSTGEPVIVWKGMLAKLMWLAMTMRYHVWGGHDFAGRLATVRALVKPGAQPDWGAPMATFAATGPALQLDIATDTELLKRELEAFAPDTLLAYPSALAALMDAGLAAPLHVWTMGETLSPELREHVRAEWGREIFDCYSSEEVGYLAIQCPQGHGYHSMDETLVVEVLDDAGAPVAPGEVGRVVVTDLHNQATPLFRYATGDHAERAGPCACGRGLGAIARVLGRTRNMIVNLDGTRHWPLTGYKRYREIAPVQQYQIVQTARDRLQFNLVVARALTPSEEAALADYLREFYAQPFAVELVCHEGRLPTGKNGKFEEFVSRIA